MSYIELSMMIYRNSTISPVVLNTQHLKVVFLSHRNSPNRIQQVSMVQPESPREENSVPGKGKGLQSDQDTFSRVKQIDSTISLSIENWKYKVGLAQSTRQKVGNRLGWLKGSAPSLWQDCDLPCDCAAPTAEGVVCTQAHLSVHIGGTVYHNSQWFASETASERD